MRTFALAFFFAVLAACHTASPAPKLPAAWAMASGAIDGGTVQAADAHSLHVRYGTARTDLVHEWTAALTAQGYEASPPQGLPGMMTVNFDKGGLRLSMLVSHTADRSDVLLTR